MRLLPHRDNRLSLSYYGRSAISFGYVYAIVVHAQRSSKSGEFGRKCLFAGGKKSREAFTRAQMRHFTEKRAFVSSLAA